MEPESTPKESIEVTQQKPKNKSNKTILFLIIIIIILALGIGGYIYRDQQAKNQESKNQETIKTLQSKITDLEKNVANSKTSTTTTTLTTTSTKISPTANQLANIKDAISSGNTAALEGYMAPTVTVIIAASEGMGDRTPAQAISDLSYLKNGTSPWNFSLDSATLTKYANGDYKTYFKSDTLVGKSANDYVVAFNFNDAGKINGIFMAVNSSLL